MAARPKICRKRGRSGKDRGSEKATVAERERREQREPGKGKRGILSRYGRFIVGTATGDVRSRTEHHPCQAKLIQRLVTTGHHPVSVTCRSPRSAPGPTARQHRTPVEALTVAASTTEDLRAS
eukprot:509851-Hanusia_phi.AAC.1